MNNLFTKRSIVRKRLKSIADIQSWFYIRTESTGDIIYLQAKYFDKFWDLKISLVPDINHEGIQKRYILKPGDILFSAKWTRNFATVYKQEYWPCIASSTFFIIKLKDTSILPEYLTILINESQWTSYFKNSLSWWTIQSIPKPALEEFEIYIPPKEKQQQTIQLYTLYKKELQLYQKLKAKKEILMNTMILHTNTKKDD
jgi:restriction endonuclease S subunit